MKRNATINRETKETKILVKLDLDKVEPSIIKTPIAFLNHMLDVFTRHGGFYAEVEASGDIEVDLHHTVEDIAITLGQAFSKALGDKVGIERYGSIILPMDDTLVRASLDLCGRPYFRTNLEKGLGKIGSFDIDNCTHFFRSFSDEVKMNLHLDLLEGYDRHHIIEASYKAISRSLKQAIKVTGNQIPSTKGSL